MAVPPVDDPSIKSGRVSSTEGDTSDDRLPTARPPHPARGRWDGLEILEEIGHGGFGRVYRAWEPTLAREVALKIIRPPQGPPSTAAAILREGQMLARVRHPNVVTIHGAQQIANEVGLWMEFVRGRTLADIVASDGPRAAGEAALIGITVCQALAAVHQAGIVHGDVKAQNVMREAGGRIVLMDFGAGQALTETGSPGTRPIGTPVYMAPEVIAGSRPTISSDIYSVGVLLYYLVTGSYPVEGRVWNDFLLAHARSERRHLADVRPDLPPWFVNAVERASMTNPDQRYATPGALLRDLAEAARGGEATTERVTAVTTRDRIERRTLFNRRASRIGAALASGTIAVWLLGAMTSYVFNHSLRRSGFANESMLEWWTWGFRSIVPAAIYIAMLMVLWTMIASVWHLLARMVPTIGRFAAQLRAWRTSLVRRLGFEDPETAAQAVVVAQVSMLIVICWQFRDLLAAVSTFVDVATAADIEPLRPVHFERHQNYNLAVTLLIFAGSIGARRVSRLRARAATTRGRGSLSAVFAILAASFVFLVFPYRLMWHNERELATHGSLSCYVLGERAADLLLYCPASEIPKTRVVARTDPRLQRSQQIESIYTR